MRNLVIIGLDGATWDLLLPLAESGFLPNIQTLLDNGVYGILESSIPPITAPAWVSFATGKNPGKHGIYDFIMPEESLANLRTISSMDIKSKTFYELLDSKGYRSILINLPVSYPPRNSYITLTSLLTKGGNYSFPESIAKEIPEIKEYRIFPDASLAVKKDKKEYFENIRDMERRRYAIAKALFENKPWDLFFVLFSGTDWVQHMVFDQLISNSFAEGHPAMSLYKDLDEYIGYFLKHLPKGANMIILSDHGFRTYKGIVYINRLLEEHGLLRVKDSLKKEIHITEFEEQVSMFKHKIRIRLPIKIWNFIRRCNLVKLLNLMQKNTPIHFYLQAEADVENTFAYYLTFESLGIYINSRKKFEKSSIIAPEKYIPVENDIINILRRLKESHIIHDFWKDTDIYIGQNLKNVPDLIFLPENYWPSPLLLTENDKVNAPLNHHDLYGIFLAFGPDFKKGEKVENMRIYDIAPTILHLFDLPIPADIDGKVAWNIFEEDSYYKRKIPEYVSPKYYDRFKEKYKIKSVIERLKL